jgi:flagellar biosynthesis/type III secretory pathway chaperone
MTVNDARLFAVESRVTEEEEMRVKEYEYIRDLMKKLIYALEQINMVNIENKKLVAGKEGYEDNSNNMLPNLNLSGKD